MGLHTYNRIHTHTSQTKMIFLFEGCRQLDIGTHGEHLKHQDKSALSTSKRPKSIVWGAELHASHQKRCFLFLKQCWLQMICLDNVYSCIFWVSKVHEYPAESMLFRKCDCELQWISRMKAEWLWIQCVCMYMDVPVLKTVLMILDPLTIIDHILIRSHKYILYIPLYCL